MDQRPHRRRDRGTELSDDQLVAMGEVTVWAARAERTLALVVSALVNDNSEAGTIVTNGMQFGQLLDLGTRLIDLRPVDDQARELFTRFAQPLKTAMQNRNHLIHSEWTAPRQGPPLATLTRSRGKTEKEFPLEAIERVANDLALLSNRLYVLHLVVIGLADYDEWAPPVFTDDSPS